MPIPRGLTDSRMLTGMGQFNATCTVQQNTPTTDSMGGTAAVWANLAGHIDLPCSFYQPTGKRGGGEERTPDGTFLDAFSIATLQGAYPDIVEAMRLVVAGTAYDIKIASTDSQGIATTVSCELIR